MHNPFQGFGEDVRCHLRSTNEAKQDGLLGQMLTDEVILDVDVFRASMLIRVFSECDAALTVRQQRGL